MSCIINNKSKELSNEMKLGFNEGTTYKSTSLSENLELCEKLGYDFIEPRSTEQIPDYLSEGKSLEDLKEWFDNHKLKPLTLNTLCFFNNRSEEDEQLIIEEFKTYLDMAKRIGCPNIAMVPSSREHLVNEKVTLTEINEDTARMLRMFGLMAEKYNIRLALEFIGIPQATVNTFKQAVDIIELVDLKNVGIIYDTFQCQGMGSRPEDINESNIKYIFSFHINDVDDLVVGHMTDKDRCWPGEGIIDLDKHIQQLLKYGYDDVATIELFRPEYYEMEAEYVIRKSKETMLNVLFRNGVKLN